ncbi:MAG: NUDIX domain-containing protein [Bacteroidetes bacterium]|nr:NUDIX domain-containing protein [Bacteroidota bacterium]
MVDSPSKQPPLARFCLRCGSQMGTRQDGEQARQVCPECGWVYYPKPSPASAVAIMRAGKVLMVRRKYEPFAGQWTLPSGFMEYGEGPEETAVRELREELGVKVGLTGLLGVLMERGDPRGLCLLVVYTGEIESGEPIAGDDASEVGAFPLDQLPEQIAFKAHREALERLRAHAVTSSVRPS